ncbi:IS3 family transposase [Actinomadura adrarensis]|uniref:IS3 family transposase n=1 Tax=Actinomadura adrarensis TaxID=1819600 RepID=A0ABW3CRV3_9ACTN
MTSRYEFIDAEYANPSVRIDGASPSIVRMCEWLGVSRSGFYEWRTRPESATARRRDELKVLVRHFFDASDGTYGYRRIHAGVAAGLELVRSLMRELGLEPCQPRPWRASLTEQDGSVHRIPDLVGRDFTAEAPGRKLVGSGSRRESHPPAPTEPCVIVSHYTALVILITRNCGTIASERTSVGIAV